MNYKAGDKDLDKKYESFKKFWNFAGKEYCRANNLKHINKNDDLDEELQMHESGVIVIAMDMSGSMKINNRWDNAVLGAKQLIQHIVKHHQDKNVL